MVKRGARKKKRPTVVHRNSVAFKLDKITREEISLSLIWLSVLLAAGIVLNGTPFISPILIIVIIGLVGSLVVLNHDK